MLGELDAPKAFLADRNHIILSFTKPLDVKESDLEDLHFKISDDEIDGGHFQVANTFKYDSKTLVLRLEPYHIPLKISMDKKTKGVPQFETKITDFKTIDNQLYHDSESEVSPIPGSSSTHSDFMLDQVNYSPGKNETPKHETEINSLVSDHTSLSSSGHTSDSSESEYGKKHTQIHRKPKAKAKGKAHKMPSSHLDSDYSSDDNEKNETHLSFKVRSQPKTNSSKRPGPELVTPVTKKQKKSRSKKTKSKTNPFKSASPESEDYSSSGMSSSMRSNEKHSEGAVAPNSDSSSESGF